MSEPPAWWTTRLAWVSAMAPLAAMLTSRALFQHEVEGGEDPPPLLVGHMGLDELGEAHVAGRGARAVGDRTTEGGGCSDARQGQVDVSSRENAPKAHEGRPVPRTHYLWVF